MTVEMLEMLSGLNEAVESGEAETLLYVYLDRKGNVCFDMEGKKQTLTMVGALCVARDELLKEIK